MYRLTPQQTVAGLVGRDDDIRSVTDLLTAQNARIVTLTGPGGVGKTRLGRHVAERVHSAFPGGVVTVDLSSVTSPDLVLPAIARGLGITDSGTHALFSRLERTIQRERILFLIDNFEQVVPAAMVIARLLTVCPGVTFLITSRMPLRLMGEREFAVSPLTVPSEATDPWRAEPEPEPEPEPLGYSAVQLFVQRATAVNHAFDPTPEMLRTIGEITRLLDGLPLAIELAAARTKVLALSAIQERLGDRLALLTGGPRDLPSRLRTMRDAIDWSHDLLTAQEKVVFRRLAVFADSFPMDAAEDVVADGGVCDLVAEAAVPRQEVMDIVHSLVDKSLLQVVPAADDVVRFRMMLTIQEYGAQWLDHAGERRCMRARTLRYYAHTFRAMESSLLGPAQKDWLARLDLDLGNIRVALATALDRGADLAEEGVRLASVIWRYWLFRGQVMEGVRWLDATLALPHDGSMGAEVRAPALNHLGNLLLELGDHARAERQYQESLELYRNAGLRDGIADELNNLGLLHMIEGRNDLARDYLERSLAIRRGNGDPTSLPATLSNLGDVAMNEGDYPRAQRLHAEALTIRQGIGNVRGIALSLVSLGTIARLRDDHPEARRYLEDALTCQAQIDDPYCLACISIASGQLDLAQGRVAQGVERLQQALDGLRRIGARRMMNEVVEVIAPIAHDFGFSRAAARMLGATHADRLEWNIGVSDRTRGDNARLIERLTMHLGDELFEREYVAGQRQQLTHAAQDVLAILVQVRELAQRDVTEPVEPVFDLGVASSRARELGLTRREQQVLGLLVRGAADKEIADALRIAPRTAMTHVSNILAKLDVNRRTAAASYALREGLVDPGRVEGRRLT